MCSCHSYALHFDCYCFIVWQVTSVFGALHVKWPDGIQKVLNWFNIFVIDLDLASPECTTSVGYSEKWFVSLGIPVFALVYFAVVYVGA